MPDRSAPVPPPDAEPIFVGPVSLWLGAKPFFASFLVDVLAIGLFVYGMLERMQLALLAGLGLLAVSAVMTLYLIARIKSIRYKITPRLIEREQGILIKTVDALDVSRIKDVVLRQSLLDRMVNVGTLVIFSSDRVDPVLTIEALPAPRPIYEKLRDAVIETNRQRGVVIE